MNKLMLASLSLLLAGATAVPAQAQDERGWDRDASGQPGQVGTSGAEVSPRGEGRQDRGEDRREERQERGADRQGRSQVLSEAVREQREERRDWASEARPGQPGYGGVTGAMPPVQQPRDYDRRADYAYDGGGYYDESWGGSDYYYGWYEDGSTSSFSLYPGSDPGDSLETYLGNSVVY